MIGRSYLLTCLFSVFISYKTDYFEVMRGLSGMGDYHLKSEFSRASIPSDELVLPKKLVAPSEIIEYLKQEQTTNNFSTPTK